MSEKCLNSVNFDSRILKDLSTVDVIEFTQLGFKLQLFLVYLIGRIWKYKAYWGEGKKNKNKDSCFYFYFFDAKIEKLEMSLLNADIHFRCALNHFWQRIIV